MDNDDNYRKTPLFKKAEEIRKLATAIVESGPEKADPGNTRLKFAQHMLDQSKDDIMQHAHTIGAKIAGAFAVDLYDLQMENACLIRRSCREMVVALRGLEMAGYSEQAYFDLLRQAVEEFRPLFAAWVATFKGSDYLYDDWELFNPPGAIRD